MPFPTGPVNGQVYTASSGVVYVYDAGKTVWDIRPTNVFKRQATTAPTNPVYGDMWFDTSTLNTFVWTSDGTSDFWLDISGGGGGSGGSSASAMTGATALVAGTSGLTPTNAAGTNYKFLRGDGTWAGPTFVSASAPTVNDDSGDGFFVGAMWYDSTAGTLYTAKSVAAGAAVWSQMGGGAPLSTFSAGQFGVGSTVLTLSFNVFGYLGYGGNLAAGATINITAANKLLVLHAGGTGVGQDVDYGTWRYLGCFNKDDGGGSGGTVAVGHMWQRIA